MFTNMLRKRMESKCTCTRLRRRSEAKDPAQTTCLRILQEAGKANKTVYAFFLDAKRMIRSGGMAKARKKRWMESYGGS
jgi:hypothetical protein